MSLASSLIPSRSRQGAEEASAAKIQALQESIEVYRLLHVGELHPKLSFHPIAAFTAHNLTSHSPGRVSPASVGVVDRARLRHVLCSSEA